MIPILGRITAGVANNGGDAITRNKVTVAWVQASLLSLYAKDLCDLPDDSEDNAGMRSYWKRNDVQATCEYKLMRFCTEMEGGDVDGGAQQEKSSSSSFFYQGKHCLVHDDDTLVIPLNSSYDGAHCVVGVLVYGPAVHVLDVPIKKVFKSDRLFYFLLPETPEQEDASQQVTGMLSTASTLAQMDLLKNATTKADATLHLSKATRALKDSTTEVVESLADTNELKIEVKKASDVPIQGITATVASLSKLAIREDLLDYLHGPHGLIPPSLYQSIQKIQQEITLEGNNTVIKLKDETTRVVQLAEPLFMTSSSSSSLPMIALENARDHMPPPRHDDDDVTSKTVLGCLFMNVRELRLAGVKIMSNVKEDARELVVVVAAAVVVKNTITEMKNSGKRLLGAVRGDTSVLRVLFKGLATIPMALSRSHKLIERMSFHCQQLYGRVNHALSTDAESIAITGLKERFKQIAASILVLRREISTLVKRDTSSPLLKLTLEDFQRQQSAASDADLSKWIM
ncbi:hypothetical protein FOZ62_010983, partial [Perkinsus olseni]